MKKAEELIEIAGEHVGESYSFGAKAPKNDPSFKGPWDCAEFVSWVVFQKIDKLYGCDNNDSDPATADAFTGFWTRDAEDLDLSIDSIDIDEAIQTPGAILLRGPKGEKIGHIVISDGAGGTIEAHSTNTGVIRGGVSNRRWDCGIKLPELAYSRSGTAIFTPPEGTIFRFKSPMMKGDVVRQIQEALTSRGFDTKGADGIFGRDTANAVIAFQEANDLVADGEVGPKTAALLNVNLS